MKLRVAAVGRLRHAGFRSAADEYLGRLKRYARCEEVEARDDAALRRLAQGADTLVALEVRGRAMTSEELAKSLERWSCRGKGEITFLIGGAEGIPKDLSASAHDTLSLSTLTLPHQLARVLLLEQLYRGFTILRGEPYARED